MELPGITPVVVGCVEYRAVASPDHHQTGFILMVHRILPDEPGAQGLISPQGGDVPASLLGIISSVAHPPIID